MAKAQTDYVCPRCGQEVRVVSGGLGVLVCCNVPMERRAPEEGEDVGRESMGSG